MGDHREITTVLEREARDDRSIARYRFSLGARTVRAKENFGHAVGQAAIDKAPGLLVIVQKSTGLINKQRRAVFFDDAKK